MTTDKTQSFTTTLVVDQTPQRAFEAINDVRGWWSGSIDGPTDVLGGEFTYRYKKMHSTTQRVTELVPGKKVVWHVTESHLHFVGNPNEWDGTDVVFEIARKGDETEIRFTHVGLVPPLECYDACSGGWGFYVKESLRDFIEKGAGKPNQGDRGRGAARATAAGASDAGR